MSKPLLVFFEGRFSDLGHVSFNAGLLLAAREAFREARVAFWACEPHIGYVRDAIRGAESGAAEGIEFDRQPDPPPLSRVRGLGVLREIGRYVALARKARRLRASALVACSIGMRGLALLRAARVIGVGPDVFVTIDHADLAERLERERLRPLEIVEAHRPGFFRRVVLGEPILRAARARGLARETSAAIDLPVIECSLPLAEDNPVSSSLRFGFLGIGTKRNGIDRFLQIATGVRREGLPATFVLTSRHFEPSEPGRAHASAIERPAEAGADEYLSRVDGLDYVLGLQDSSYYQLSASLAFATSVARGKPGLWLRNPYIDHYFKEMGNIGYLFDDVRDLEREVVELVRKGRNLDYEAQRARLREVQGRFSPAHVARGLREALLPIPALELSAAFG